MAEYGQGMVRPGLWAKGTWLDDQWRIAKTVDALHTDISTFWEHHSWDSPEDRARIVQMYVSTSTDFQTAWVMTGTHVSMPMALRVLSGPLPSACQLCDQPNPHTHQKGWGAV